MKKGTKFHEYNHDSISIEAGIPKPKNGGGRVNKWFYIFAKMKVNDSFAIPYETDEQMARIKDNLNRSKRLYNQKHDPNFQGSIRALFLKKEVRFWRDK